ncbi:hypothetical protein JMJ55_23290 [Belnapia sp. T6]|uniref:N,N-dimethylformamidase beta subunit-like C-terminal domain-containing protein n=1 Tax=Belnapia mucosa TaxID=2804532 RepID=A0ABS1V9B9_9PROT|nr:N,N-dimethylformamidase beta subunit family domain-containing protein [Belnapia mucosa]MBL6458267.1 hypothetical protein [Belnapia mucosa]
MPLYKEPPGAADRSVNVGPARIYPTPGDHQWQEMRPYEAPRGDPAWHEIHVYTDALSYAPGETVQFHGSTNAPDWTIEVTRDGAHPTVVHRAEGLPGRFTPMPKGAYETGCGWPVLHGWTIPEDMPSGFYLVESSVARAQGGRFVQHHFFVVRPTARTRRGRILHMLPTCTYTAYNDWGGANHYAGTHGPEGNRMSPLLSLLRPWTRGMVKLPDNAPRICAALGEPMETPRYDFKEWAYANGYGYFYAATGWAQYDRHFAVWAEREGYAVDRITQADLHRFPEILDDYACVVVVGHDEYWTREMRLAIEAFVERGGRFARFGANFTWQVRLEADGLRQVCYKSNAPESDPIRETGDTARLTTAWEDRHVRWPGATTVGVNGLGGTYANWGRFTPRGSRGFTVYRPEHWAFAGTDLTYGDIFGAEARIFGYEVDGLDYTFRRGLPYPTGEDGAPPAIEILAMTPAVMGESPLESYGYRPYVGVHDWHEKAEMIYGTVNEETLEKSFHGSGMMVSMRRGQGEVLTAASCEWVMGLTRNCAYTQRITRNVLDRFSAG